MVRGNETFLYLFWLVKKMIFLSLLFNMLNYFRCSLWSVEIQTNDTNKIKIGNLFSIDESIILFVTLSAGVLMSK